MTLNHAERPCLRVGDNRVRYDLAQEWVSSYVDPSNSRSAYWAYDTYRDRDRFAPLEEADLLAPVLLNVSRLKITAFRWLAEQIGELNAALASIPREANLTGQADPSLLGPLFAVLDTGMTEQPTKVGVRATVLAKVLHRKRPGFIPLWDKHVRRCYMETPTPRVPADPDRSHREWIQVIGAAIKEDLQTDGTAWKELTALAPGSGPSLTELRALDIVAWNLGRRLDRACDPQLHT